VSEPLPVLADSRRLVEVLENLVSNAVKYSPRGGTVTIEIGRDGDNAFVQVRDEGIGVPDDERSRIFDRFFRTTVARPYGGVGLGLYISKEIVERLGGELVLQSSGANGSVFRLTLPLARREAEVAAPLGVNVGELGNR
jgi:signal transduction histidine kinase